MAIQDTDFFLVNRGDKSYKIEYRDIKGGSPSATESVEGLVELANSSEVLNGTPGNLVVTAEMGKDSYYIKNNYIPNLPELP